MVRRCAVSPSARERVLKTISELGYHPSDVARSLRTRRTLTIGLVIPDAANPYYGELARAVEEVSFQGPDLKDKRVSIDGPYVRGRLAEVLQKEDLSKFIL